MTTQHRHAGCHHSECAIWTSDNCTCGGIEQNKSPPISFPLPFDAEDNFVFAANDMRVADTECDGQHARQGEPEQLAVFIARACNSHYDMLEALDELHRYNQTDFRYHNSPAAAKAHAALAKARGQQ